MGYDYLVKKGTELTISVSVYHGDKPSSHEFKIPVSKGNKIYYEFYIKDGDLESR